MNYVDILHRNEYINDAIICANKREQTRFDKKTIPRTISITVHRTRTFVLFACALLMFARYRHNCTLIPLPGYAKYAN